MVTGINEVTEQVQKYWGPLITQELRESTLLPGLVSKQYDGMIKKGGDTVYVTEIKDFTGQIKTIGVDADSFDSEQLQKSRIAIVADKRIVASVEFDDIVELQSQISMEDSKIRAALMRALEVQLNDYLYSLVSPSPAAPDHTVTGTAAMDATALLATRLLASQALWPKDGQWFGLLDPSYYGDVLSAQTLTSKDYVDETPVVGGQVVNKRFGFNLLEDNSLATEHALFFHPNFMHLVMQKEAQFKVSDLHSNKKFGYLMSVDMIVGAKLGHNGQLLSITVEN